jgi:hypothetical protein
LHARLVARTQSITPEYRDGSLHNPSVKHIASACPPNNDYVEGMFGTIDWALSQSPEQLATILADVRKYRQSLPNTLKARAARDHKQTYGHTIASADIEIHRCTTRFARPTNR